MQNKKKAVSVKEALTIIDQVKPIKPANILLSDAIGLRPVEDVLIRRSFPETNRAALNGWVVLSSTLVKATASRPVLLAEGSRRIDSGDPIPAGFDAVLADDDVVLLRDKPAARKAVISGHGVLQIGSILEEGHIFLKAGARISLNSAVQGNLCGIGQVMVRRPVIDIICNSRNVTAQNDRFTPLIGHRIRRCGATLGAISFAGGDPTELASLVRASSADVIVTIGGTGDGPGDTTIQGLSEVSNILFHGVRMNPGGSAAFAMAGSRPILCLPGHHVDILAINALLGEALNNRILGCPPEPVTELDARLSTGLPGGKDGTDLYFGKRHDGTLAILGPAELQAERMQDADCLVIVMEGDRHKRAGEQVSCLTL